MPGADSPRSAPNPTLLKSGIQAVEDPLRDFLGGGGCSFCGGADLA